jgi:hypothetical protein
MSQAISSTITSQAIAGIPDEVKRPWRRSSTLHGESADVPAPLVILPTDSLPRPFYRS